ncbi:MAG TPA: pilus assembly protein TadG-related protein [Verrucomicrobiae bacterium]|nr:pilus assembly protein TadG-related protein [Verrucomicrobiae bacterium]
MRHGDRGGRRVTLSLGRGRSSRRRRAGGQVAVLFALAAIAIVAVVGLAFDAGRAYVDQRALQAAADTAADGGARMLAQDYDNCLNGVALTNTNTQITSAIAGLVADGVAGQGAATSSTATFTDSSGVVIGPTSTTSSASWCSASTWSPTAPRGVAVTAIDAHLTELLPIVGISSAQETAKAISVFTIFTGSGEPFVAWYQGCTSADPTNTGILAIGDTVYYHASNHWSSLVPCETNYVNSRFKGDLKPEGLNPNPIRVGNWVNAQPGQGSWGPDLTAGQTIWIPMIDVICDGVAPSTSAPPIGTTACHEPNPPPAPTGVTPPTSYCGGYTLSTSEELYMCTIAQVELVTGDACTKSATCYGVVKDILWSTPGSSLALGLQGVAVVELLQ